jgi:hypothetical protein
MKKIKRINTQYYPLNEAFSLVVKAGSLLQVHAAETDTYIPDRQITPMVIEPSFYLHDDNGVIKSGHYEDSLVDIRWYENSETPANLIISGQNGYVVAAVGALEVSKNVKYLTPLVLIFTANYYDPRTGNVLRVHESVTLSTTSLTEMPLTLELDKPGDWIFDPLTESGLRTVTATLRLAGKEVSAAERRAFWWYAVENGTERLINPENDLFYESGQNTPSLTIDPRYIDDRILIRCKAEYVSPGTPAPTQPTAGCRVRETTVNRRYSEWDYDYFINGSSQVSVQAVEIKSEGIVTSKGALVTNPTEKFDLKWNLKSQVYGAQWRTIGYGTAVVIPRNDYRNGAHLAFEVDEKKPLGPVAIGDDILTVNDEILTL